MEYFLTPVYLDVYLNGVPVFRFYEIFPPLVRRSRFNNTKVRLSCFGAGDYGIAFSYSLEFSPFSLLGAMRVVGLALCGRSLELVCLGYGLRMRFLFYSRVSTFILVDVHYCRGL